MFPLASVIAMVELSASRRNDWLTLPLLLEMLKKDVLRFFTGS